MAQSFEIPYALIPDWKGYPGNAPLKTFIGELSDDQFDVLSNALASNVMEPDSFIISRHFPGLYEEWKNTVKNLHPDWEDYAAIEVYIPEECHMMAQIISLSSR